MTTDYAAKLLGVLRQANLVESVRGKSGGYRLSRPSKEIKLDEVIRALSGELFEVNSCDQFSGNDEKCVHVDGCSIRSIWFSVSHILFALLKQITLDDLLKKEDLLSKYLKKELVLNL